MNLPRICRLALILTGLLPAALITQAQSAFPRPGENTKTPVMKENIDLEAFAEWESGSEKSAGAEHGPEWILWCNGKSNPGHSGLTFGKSKSRGLRHLRVGFKEAIPVGSVVTRGNVSVSVLKSNTAYPGNLSGEDDWIAGERLDAAAGCVTTGQTREDEIALWVFPPGTSTRALRFTHEAGLTDVKYEGWLGGALVLNERVGNLAGFAMAASESNTKHAGKLINGVSDHWNCWENINDKEPNAGSLPVISNEDPEWLMLNWPQPVQLDGLVAVWTGFGAADIQIYIGPKSLHPRDASDKDWETIASPAGIECGYPCQLWPNVLPFGKQVTTQAVRLRVTAVTHPGHPHVQNRPLGGKRIWLGELLAYQDLGSAALKIPDVAKVEKKEPNPPVAIPFTLPEAGFVTLVIEDSSGLRVCNLISETPFPAGKNIAWWDGSDDLGRDPDAAKHGLYNIPKKFVAPGGYSVRGLWRKEIKPFYEFAVYSSGNPPWSTTDHTGAWLANHSPPMAAAFVPATHSPTNEPSVFLGCYVTEGPDGMAWVDLDGKKRGGLKWIGGNWTSAPYLASDPGPKADPAASVYVAAVWETEKKSGVNELRITALEKQEENQLKPRQVYKAELGKKVAKNHNDDLGGIAVFNGVIACAVRQDNKLLFIDAATGEKRGESDMLDPRGLIYDPAGRLFVLSGTQLLRLDSPEKFITLVSEGLEDPVGIALDEGGNIYVSDQGQSHQVKVYSPDGKFVHAIGRPGVPKAGPYDPLHMNNPAGIALDSKNQLWVTEADHLPKRVSVWTREGKFIRAFYGPSKYGGGGMLDAHDQSKFYYADEGRGTLEFQIDWKQGRAELTSVPYRKSDSFELPFRSAAPETAFYREGRRYFTNCYNSNPTGGHNSAFIFLEKEGIARPAAGMGMANEWPILLTEPFKALWPEGIDPAGDKNKNGKGNQALFIWSDRNADALVQPGEIKLTKARVGGVTVMDDLSFCIARLDDRSMRFSPSNFTGTGVPEYDFDKGTVLAENVSGPRSSGGNQVLADESNEAVITLGVAPFDPSSISGVRSGKAIWSYPSPWPGLHASHEAAQPDRPGQLIGTTRLLGGFVHPKGSEVAPLWAINGNMGNIYLMTRDGLFVATIFEDVRQGKLWKMQAAERNMSLDGITLHDENFWPSISQTSSGQVYLVDGSHSSLVRLDGLETLRPIASIAIQVSAKDLEASESYVLEQETLRQKTFGSGILSASVRSEAPVVDGNVEDWAGAKWVEIDKLGVGANFNSDSKPYNLQGAIAVADGRLYAVWETQEPKLLTNSGEIPNALFKTGGALDLMLATNPKADPQRKDPVEGDLRLLITRVNKQTRALLYRQISAKSSGEKVPFSSPWRTITFDQVEDISSQVELAEDGKGHYEISVPLDTLGFHPLLGQKTKGNIGILRGSGTETTARSYWSNKATGITADIPSEAQLTPALWGTMEWR